MAAFLAGPLRFIQIPELIDGALGAGARAARSTTSRPAWTSTRETRRLVAGLAARGRRRRDAGEGAAHDTRSSPSSWCIGILIVIHELGHFVMARLCGVGVERFSIGFGPVLWRYRGKETEYCLSAIPMGGYVKMMGDDENPLEGGRGADGGSGQGVQQQAPHRRASSSSSRGRG